MHHFFVKKEQIFGKEVYIWGDDYRHAIDVVRLKMGEKVLISTPNGEDFICVVDDIFPGGLGMIKDRHVNLYPKGPGFLEKDTFVPEAGYLLTDCVFRMTMVEAVAKNNELPSRVTLYQCLPKGDVMDHIIRKSVELGVSEIVPVISKNTVVQLDQKRAESKNRRWQAVARAAAEQSKRSIIPQILPLHTLREALDYCETDIRLIPYEKEDGLDGTIQAIASLIPGQRIAVLIGPEGGFEELEISMARRHGFLPISLGARILRVETAAICALSLIMIRLEIAAAS